MHYRIGDCIYMINVYEDHDNVYRITTLSINCNAEDIETQIEATETWDPETNKKKYQYTITITREKYMHDKNYTEKHREVSIKEYTYYGEKARKRYHTLLRILQQIMGENMK